MRRVMLHGLLHLCGYHDSSQKEKKKMREKEDCYLRALLPEL
ncbi:MAG: rRNA maturation RNAse YbeY [Prevotellaceae bacterium]|nr:rRNA maturation RNAse YbeY [Prevotellaceae bacterium]